MINILEDMARILVVEDDTNLLSAIREILQLEHYHVLTATNGLEGLKLLRQDADNPPDVIVSDVMMPHMDGFTFLEEVRKVDQWVTVPFIFLTAKGERQDRYKGGELGADVYLVKPFDPQDFVMAVGNSLKRKRNIQRVQETQVSGVKREILTILNHEFRTPLTLVVAYADMLKDFQRGGMTDQEVMTFLRGVNSGADRLRRLIENFIILVEIDSGDAGRTYAWRKRATTSLRDMVRDAHQQIVMTETRPRSFVFNVPDTIPPIVVDQIFMTMVIRELLDNAAKFSLENGTVELTVTHDDEYVYVTVQDWGRGIPTDEYEKIWERFYQIDRPKHEDQGAGSGLAIVAGLMTIHAGQYTLVESAEGKGSTFRLSIPIQAPSA